VLSEEKVNILSATVSTTRDRVAVSRFSFEMADPQHLKHLLGAVRRVDGVYDAYRGRPAPDPRRARKFHGRSFVP
jgi:GTP pyrophosphokinase